MVLRAGNLLSSARSCPKRPCAVQPCSHSVRCPALRPARRSALQLASRTALPCSPARRALLPHCFARCAELQPARCALLPRASRSAAARASRSAAPCVTPYCSTRIAPCCPVCRALLQPARRALLQPARRALLPSATLPAALHSARPAALSTARPALQPAARPAHPAATAAAAAAAAAATAATTARATATAGGGAAGSAAGAGGAGGATGSDGGADGAGGTGGATGSAGGAAGAGGARPTTDRHCLSWPLSRQLQRLGWTAAVTTSPGRPHPSAASRVGSSASPSRWWRLWFSAYCTEAAAESAGDLLPADASESTAALGASEFAAALGASEPAAALGASESAAAPDASASAVALGARASPTTGPSSAEALHTFTLDSGASRCFFRDCTTVIPLAAQVPVLLANPTGGPVVARASTVLPCPAVPSGSLSGLHLPTFSTNLVSNAAIQDAWVDILIPGGQRVAICTCSRTGRHLATLSSSTTASVTPPCRVSAACTPVSLSLGFPGPCPPSCVEGRQRAAPHSSEFPPTTAPLQTLHMDVWGPAPVGGTDQER
ncbi:unnamed protein product [Closterium sp. NIES-53]